MDRGGHLWDGVSVAGDQEEPVGGRDDGACDHEFFAGGVDRVEGGLEVLVSVRVAVFDI